MIKDSFLIGLALRIWGWLTRAYENSMLGRIFSVISSFFVRLWQSSRTHIALTKPGHMEASFEHSIAGRLLKNPSLSKYVAPHIEKSHILSYISSICSDLIHMPVRSYGLMLFITGLMPTAAGFVLGRELDLIFAVIAGLGFVLALLNRSFAQLFSGSSVLQKGLSFFFVNEIKAREAKARLLIFAGLGVLFGGAGFVFGLAGLILAVGGIIGGALILWRVEIGVFTAAFFIPILPTMLILGLVAATTASFLIKVLFTGSIKMKFNYLDAFVLLFAGLVAYGLVISYNVASSRPVVLLYIIFIMFYFVVKNTISTKDRLMALVAVIAASGLFVALFGIWQYLTGNFTMTTAWVDQEMFGEMTVRIYSTLENPNVLGGFLIFITILVFAMIYYYNDYIHKIFALGIFGVASLCMILTHSRGAWLGLLLAVGLFVLIRNRRLFILGLIALALAPLFIPPEVLQRFLSIGDMADTSTSHRMSIYFGAIDMIRVFWPIGIGQGVENFNYIYNMFALSAAFAQHSHNLYLQIIIYWGIAGITLFLIVIGGFFKGLFQVIARGSTVLKTLAAAIAAGMAGFLLKGFTDNVLYNFRVLAFFWLIVAVAAVIANLKESDAYEKN